jgi:hypothetical protein
LAGWRESLGATTIEGRTVDSLGPIVLGNRLNSSRARNGYRAIVYRKGAVVLAMLARAVGEEPFLQMLRSLADAAQHRVLTTEAFLKALERMSGRELDAFARQYVYGTGIPEVYYDHGLAPEPDGGWAIEGDARVVFAPRHHYGIVYGEGVWDVRRMQKLRTDDGPTALMVPYQIEIDDAPQGESGGGERGSRVRQGGQLTLEGRRDAFRIRTERRPVAFRLDPRGEILARFYSAQSHPKRFLYHQAEELAAANELTAAEARYHEALAVPSETETRDPLASRSERGGTQGRMMDLRIRLALTRVYLDQGRLADAAAALDEIDRESDASNRTFFRMQRDALRSRLEILRGEFGPAYHRLKKTLRLASPRRVRVPWRNLLLQVQLNTERAAVTEAYALLAIAANEAGKPEIFRWALREARDRRVDVSLLEQASGISPSAGTSRLAAPEGPASAKNR